MGHDIYAYKKVGSEHLTLEEEVSLALRIDDYNGIHDGKDWSERYREYSETVNVAYLRRSMGNPLRAVIYVALKADRHYAGVSGNGSTQSFTAEQIDQALQRINAVFYPEKGIKCEWMDNFPDFAREWELVRDQNYGLRQDFREELEGEEVGEIAFLEACKKHLAETGAPLIEIYFG